MTVNDQSEIYWDTITTRKRNPVKGATLNAYRSYLNKWILPELGSLEVSVIENGRMKKFVQKLVEAELKPASVMSITNCLKNLIGSAVDENGNEIYPRKWNNDFIDLPIVNPKDQKSPTVTKDMIETVLKSVQQPYRTLFVLLAGTGLRISESLAIRNGPDDAKNSFWIPGMSKLVVRVQIFAGNEQSTKTSAGNREVDLAPELNEYMLRTVKMDDPFCFQNTDGRPFHIRSLYDLANRLSVPGFHSFRRFRTTHLRGQGCPEDILKFWIGHAAGSITDRYSKLSQDIQLRKEWAGKVGLGFDL